MEDFTELYEFAEGSLDSAAEQELFNRLASSGELRGELKQLMTLNSAIGSNRSLFTVPPDSKAKIFSSIGFQAIPQPVPLSIPTRISDFFRRNYLRMFGGLACAAAGAVAALMLFGNNGGFDDKKITTGSNNNGTTSVASVPMASSLSSDGNIASALRDTVVVVKYVIVREKPVTATPDIAPASESALADNIDNASSIKSVSLSAFSKPKQSINLSRETYSHSLPVGLGSPEYQFLSDMGLNNKKLKFEVKGSQYWNLPEASINPSKYAMFNNTALAVLYDLSDNLSLGLDIRQETFFQAFDGTDNYGLPVSYEQQPNFTSFGGILRYDSRELHTIRPIYQIIIGGNKVGVIGRAAAGLAYSPYSDVSFLLGLEYSHLFYSYQGNTYASKKLGLNYGVLFGF